MTTDSGLLAPGTRLVDAFNKETFVFHDLREGPSAEFVVLLEAGDSGCGMRSSVSNGIGRALHGARRRMEADDRWLGGDSWSWEKVTVPRGAAHYFANPHDGPTEVTIRFTPSRPIA
jgi:hypothetical protein